MISELLLGVNVKVIKGAGGSVLRVSLAPLLLASSIHSLDCPQSHPSSRSHLDAPPSSASHLAPTNAQNPRIVNRTLSNSTPVRLVARVPSTKPRRR